MKWMFGVLGLLLVSPVSAQGKVYKCVVDGTTTYSQQPCGRNAQEVDVPAAPKLDPREVAMRAAYRKNMADAARKREMDRQEAGCVNRLSAGVRRSTGQQIEQAQAEIATIEQQRVYYNPRSVSQSTYAQTFTNGQNARIAALRAAIDRAKMRRTEAVSRARQTCAGKRRQAQDVAWDDN